MPGPKSRIDWTRWDSILGSNYDGDIAKKIQSVDGVGCSRDMVRSRRKEIGVAPFYGVDPEKRRRKVDWEHYGFYLGSMNDCELQRKIVAETGVEITHEAVRKMREARRKAAFEGRSREQRSATKSASFASAAQRIGVSLEEYTANRSVGLKFCNRCRDWHHESQFPARGGWRGKIAVCREWKKPDQGLEPAS